MYGRKAGEPFLHHHKFEHKTEQQYEKCLDMQDISWENRKIENLVFS